MVNALPKIWRFVDGKAGHERQTAGFIKALEQTLSCEVHEFDAHALRPLASLLRNKIDQAPAQRPDLIVGAGRACQIGLLTAKKVYGGKTIYFMRPGVPTSWFDLCVIPGHDKPAQRHNIVVTEGVLNDLRPAENKDPTLGIMLVGGPSKHHRWNTAAVIAQIESIVSYTQTTIPAFQFKVSASRRTPQDTIAALQSMAHIEYVSHEETDSNWLPQVLAHAGQAWVSADSVSMLFEALSSGTKLGILDVPARRPDRVATIALDLVARGYATGFKQWQVSREMNSSPTLREAERVAALVVEKFSLGFNDSR